jgi:hypothetical protein
MLDDGRSDQRDASSTRQVMYDPPPHTAGLAAAASSSQYIDPLKRACLPRLVRERDSQASSSQSAPRSLTDRLNQMRVEDRRRERNSEQRQHGTVSTRACTAFDATSTASARAGSLYYQSSQLAQQDRTERQQIGEMMRKFAGPTPPTSWRKEIISRAEEMTSLDISCDASPRARKKATLALRWFIDGGEEMDGMPLLSDLCLSRLSASLCEIEDRASSIVAREMTNILPVHLKEKMMALAGRKQHCEPLNTTALHLLLDDGEEPTKDIADLGSDSWDSNEVCTTSDPISLKCLDLSFARIGVKMLKSVLVQGAGMHQLRTLSLAGWGSDDCTRQKSLLSVTNLMEAIGSLPHLEMLSLAKTRLGPVGKGTSSKTRDSKMLESITFLKRLSRASLRLKVLDLSECDWIVGPDIANLGWYSVDKAASRSKIIWPRLEHLVLINCAALMEPGRVVEKELTPSPSYVAKWHAAHHGVALVTDSPYLLQHRPGLGNAIFHAEDAQQARQARQRRSAQRQARSRDGDAWGSDESQDEDSNTIRSSSSSAYPTRCPVSGVHVGAWEWERARVLDAVRGRWGSAIKGDITVEGLQASGPFIEIYF